VQKTANEAEKPEKQVSGVGFQVSGVGATRKEPDPYDTEIGSTAN
jgi:hypothetical protein